MIRHVRWAAAAPFWRRETEGALLAAAVLLLLAVTVAQAPTLPAVKAAFLYNFATFAEWPADSLAVEQNLSLCVIGDDAIAEALNQTVKGRAIRGHKVMVEVIKEDGKVRACHLLFASGYDPARTTQLARALKGASVLTVSDGDRFAASGGIAQLYVENERMRFAINAAAADRARVHLSSKLLNLAKMIRDESNDGQR